MPDAADLLAGNDTPTPPPQAAPPTNELGDPLTPPTPPPPTNELGDPIANLGNPNPPQPPPTTPANQDPEMVAGAAHQHWLGKTMSGVIDALAGTQTHHVVKDPDGTYSVHLDPSTTKEQWGRIAALVLGGAAKGLAAGQGPGGAAKAVSAGFQSGFDQQNQISSQATAQEKAKNEELTFKANHAMTDQQLISLKFNNQMNPIRTAQEEGEYEIKLQDLGATMEAHPANAAELATYNKANPNLMNGHLMKDGSVLIPSPQLDGSVKIWRVPPDAAKMKVDHDVTYTVKKLDNDGNIVESEETIPKGTKTTAEVALALKGNDLASNNTINTSLTLKNQREKTQLDKNKDQREAEELPSIKARNNAAAAESNARAKQIKQQAETEAGTPEENAEAIFRGDAAPSQFSKRAKEYNQVLAQAEKISMERTGKHFDVEQAENRYKAKQGVINAYAYGTEAHQIQSFNQFLGHSKELSDNIQMLRNTKSPLLNMPINKLRTMTGDPRVATILPLIEAVRTEHQNFLNNNHALHNETITAGHQMLNENQGLGAMEGAMKSFAATALIRTGTLNDMYKRTQHSNVPDILNQDSMDALDNYGLKDQRQRLLPQTAGPGAAPAAQGGGGGQPTATIPAGAHIARDKTDPTKILGYQIPGQDPVWFPQTK